MAIVEIRDVLQCVSARHAKDRSLQGLTLDIESGQLHRADGTVGVGQVDPPQSSRGSTSRQAAPCESAGAEVSAMERGAARGMAVAPSGFVFQSFNM